MRASKTWTALVLLSCFAACSGKHISTLGDVSGGGAGGAPDEPDANGGEPSCNDGSKNGGETDVDCGGGDTTEPGGPAYPNPPGCGACAVGQGCKASSDCATGLCVNDVCQPAGCTGSSCQPERCDDGVLNGRETDIDCGGGECPQCAVDQVCGVASDCETGLCWARASDNWCFEAHCGNGEQDADESDVDCGGADCPTCSPGQQCEYERDCYSRKECRSGACADGCDPEAEGCERCDDGVRNGDETDVDCGGGCQPCDVGRSCSGADDCASEVCGAGVLDNGAHANVCLEAHCDNGEKDVNETDVDCGGADCQQCDFGAACEEHADCEGGRCRDGVCIQFCNDASVDCGSNAICVDNACQYCTGPSDCNGGECRHGYCN